MANEKPIPQSVTGEPCHCRTLEDAADEPNSPIEYDAEVEEYNIVTRDGGSLRIYHCFFCGGAAPRSKRGSLFAVVIQDERDRLRELTSGFASLTQVIEKFGEPDDDMDTGSGSITPERDGQPPKFVNYRTLRYRSLSTTADVDFVDYGPDHGVRASFSGKYLVKKVSF